MLDVPAWMLLVLVLAGLWAAAVVGRPVPVPLGAALVVAVLLLLGDQAVAALRLVVRGRISRVLVAVGVGTTVLMTALLALNTVGPLVGVARPLSAVPVAVTVTLTALLLHLPQARRTRQTGLTRHVGLPVPRAGAVLGGAALALIPLAGGASAVALDNGRGPVLGVVVISTGLVLLAVLGLRRQPPSRGWIAAAVYAVSLSWLLMSSLRGPSITGHDVQTEHYAAQLAATAGHWSPSAFPSDYNACLSVTVLPAALGALLHIGVVPWFTAVAQILFALCPVAVAVAGDRLAGPRLGLAAAVLFAAFPTFVVDLSMMVRQEVAFLLVAVIVLLLVQRHDDATPGALGRLRLAVLLVGAGVVLSHYSTSYVLMVQLGVAAIACAALKLFRIQRGVRPVFTLPLVAVLASVALLWGGSATGTGGSAVHVAGQVIGVLTGRVVDQVGSGDASVSIFGGGKRPTPQDRLDNAVDDIVDGASPEQKTAIRSVLTQFPLAAPPEEVQPLTPVGRFLRGAGIDVDTVIAGIRTASAQLLQVLVGFGVLAALWQALRRRRDPELALMAAGALVVLASFVLMPLLTAAYGLLRVFQQGLLVAAVPTVVVLARSLQLAPGAALLATGRWRRAGRVRGRVSRWSSGRDLPARVALLVVIAFAVSSTSLLSALTGGYQPALTLASTGPYARSFTTSNGELAMFHWVARQPAVKAQGGQAVQADLWTGIRFWSQTQVSSPPLGMLPLELRDGTYVLVGSALLKDGTATTGTPNLAADYAYPVPGLTSNRDLVYNDTSAQVWR
ncbi:hypothetical protein [Quadrisphaera granulorum]|uniref:hypothetical protein n=1 Tax=Quadrisphaera granulorum TaxID=317664 RepID=UPI0011B3967C|nr:hypothetical protein [Quadrisphaera granulorum]